MDMAEILGALLENKAGAGGSMGNILKDLLGGGAKAAPAPQARAQAQRPAPPPRHGDSDFGALVRDAHSRYGQRHPTRVQAPAPAPRSELDDEKAKLLVRAMVNAAKADGQLDQAEQEKILGQLGDVTQEEIEFLEKEFAAPLDVREFSWSVPLGQENEVYGFSLMAIGLDERKEARYLQELAHGLRIPPEACNQIHQQVGAPLLFR